tara:strand:- start:470 stop:1057 length:588 start_codon:yes stop_codon:yes gene_type:complete
MVAKLRIICCRFGEKFTDWHIDNLKHMIDTYSGIEYDEFEVMEEDLYGNWYNKLLMFDKFRDGENLYFDLDVVIHNKLPNLVRKNFTLLYDGWWREPAHTPLNSSIVSWTGDESNIYDHFDTNEEYFLKKYNKGSDEYYYKEDWGKDYETYGKVCPSIKHYLYEKSPYGIVTLGQYHHLMEKGWTGWWSEYFIPH